MYHKFDSMVSLPSICCLGKLGRPDRLHFAILNVKNEGIYRQTLLDSTPDNARSMSKGKVLRWVHSSLIIAAMSARLTTLVAQSLQTSESQYVMRSHHGRRRSGIFGFMGLSSSGQGIVLEGRSFFSPTTAVSLIQHSHCHHPCILSPLPCPILHPITFPSSPEGTPLMIIIRLLRIRQIKYYGRMRPPSTAIRIRPP